MKTIYADEVFLLNLAINYCILLATAKLCALPLKRRRFALSAALGAAYAVGCLLPGLGFLSTAVMKGVLGVLMALAAFGGSAKLWRATLAFFAVSAAFGGAVFAASMLAGSNNYVNPSFRVLLLSFSACYFVLTVIFRRLAKKRERSLVDIILEQNGKTARFTALCDTGNELFDPLSGLPVMVVQAQSLAAILPEGAAAALSADVSRFMEDMAETGLKLRLVPCSTVSGRALLPVFRPEAVTVNGSAKKDLLVGISAAALSADGEYSAVINIM